MGPDIEIIVQLWVLWDERLFGEADRPLAVHVPVGNANVKCAAHGGTLDGSDNGRDGRARRGGLRLRTLALAMVHEYGNFLRFRLSRFLLFHFFTFFSERKHPRAPRTHGVQADAHRSLPHARPPRCGQQGRVVGAA